MPSWYISGFERPRGPIFAGAAAGGDTTTGLIDYWPFDDGSGTTFLGTSHNGTLTSSGLWGSGFVTFDGTNYGTVPDDAAFNVGATFTAFGWVSGAAQQEKYIFTQWNGGGAGQRSWAVASSPSGSFNTIYALVSDDGTTGAGHFKEYVGSQTFLDSSWHSFAIRFNSGVFDLFVDGVKDTSVTKTTDDAITSAFNSNSDVGFGVVFSNGSAVAQYNGSAQRFRLYSTAKTDADILAIHSLGHA